MHQLDGQRQAGEVGKGQDAGQGAFQLADVGLHLAGDGLEDLVRHLAAGALGLGAQDGDAGLQVGRLDIDDQAPLEARAQAFLQGHHGLGRAVGGDDDLLVLPVQGVEGVEELLLGRFLAGDELDVVDQQHVDAAVVVAEVARCCARGWS